MVFTRMTMVSTMLVLVVLLVMHQAASQVRNSHQGPPRRGNRGGVLYGKSRDADSSWAGCKEPVCQEVGRQAEGLLRLKDLRNYIVETMRLMDSLVTSVDAELVNQGAELAKFVGPLCRDTHQKLLNITTPSANANLDMGVGGPLSQNIDRFPTINNEVTGSKTHARRKAKIDSTWEEDAEHGEFDQDNSESRIVETYSSSDSSSSSNKRRPSGNDRDGRQLHPVTGTSHHYGPHGATGTVASAGIPSTSGGGGGGGYGGANSIDGGGVGREDVTATGFGSGGRGYSNDGVSGCRGVERGSEHWVPGLDSWCATNCATGHCPETHCVC